MQKMILIGNVGKDPIEKTVPSGKKVTNFSLGVRAKTAKDEATTWYEISIWGSSFETMLRSIKKGSRLMIMGRLATPRIYKNTSGEHQLSLSVTCESIEYMPSQRPPQEPQEYKPRSMKELDLDVEF